MKKNADNLRIVAWSVLVIVALYVFLWSPGIRERRNTSLAGRQIKQTLGILNRDNRFSDINIKHSALYLGRHVVVIGSVENIAEMRELENIISNQIDKRFKITFAVQVNNTTTQDVYKRLNRVPNV